MPTTYFDPYAGLPASDEMTGSTPGVPNPLWFLPSPLTVNNTWAGAQTFSGPVTFGGGVVGAGAGGGPVLAVAAVTATAGALVVNKHNPVDATSAPLTMTLPTGQAQGSIIIAEKYDATTNAVTVSGNIRGVPASTDVLVLAHQTTMFEADAAGSWWPVSSHKALATLDGRYVPQTQTQVGTATLVISDRTAGDALAGHWLDQVAGATFFTVADSVRQIGYNVPPGGGTPANPAGGTVYDQWESDYYQNGTARKMERHIGFYSRNIGATTIAVASNGQTLPQATINVASTASFPTWGTLTIGLDTVTYTGITATTFTGCAGGTHALTTGEAVTQAGGSGGRPLMLQFDWQTGALNQFTLLATNLTINDWVTGAQVAALGLGTFTFNTGLAAGATMSLQAGPGLGSSLALWHNNAVSLGFSTQSAANCQLTMQGVQCVSFFTSRGISINVVDNTAAFTVVGSGAGGNVAKILSGPTAGDLTRWQESGGTTHIKVTQATSAIPASLVVGKAVLANAATDGFLYIPTVAGAPSGVPTAQTGTVPILFDTTNNFLYAYLGGAWKKTTVFA